MLYKDPCFFVLFLNDQIGKALVHHLFLHRDWGRDKVRQRMSTPESGQTLLVTHQATEVS